ncbi:hypothetical protein XENTR_v10000827 [Xenopus tropicalis]|nr:hypothetical protein XENTR_v10000827 [Xenopus tropicalis]
MAALEVTYFGLKGCKATAQEWTAASNLQDSGLLLYRFLLLVLRCLPDDFYSHVFFLRGDGSQKHLKSQKRIMCIFQRAN